MTVRRTAGCQSISFLRCVRSIPTFEELLLQLCLCDLNLHGLVDLLGMTATVIGVVFDGSREEGVDERRLSKAGFASDHDSKCRASLSHDLVALVRQLVYVNECL